MPLAMGASVASIGPAAGSVDLVGIEVGGYRIVRLIGQGGMGSVFEARHTLLNQAAAVKVTRTELATDKVIQRFITEAQALSSVRHRGLVQIFDCGRLADGRIYILMELLDGESIGERIRRLGRLPAGEAVQLAGQIADALQAVHKRGVIHRDLTPSNVLIVANEALDGGELAKVFDFGLAKLRTGQPPTTLPEERFGTPRYMSPEQCEGARFIDDQVDVYALGLLLFEMLTGESPYPLVDADALAWMYAHIEKSPRRLREVAPQLDPEFEALIAQMLNKSPGLRPTMSAVATRLLQHGAPLAAVSGSPLWADLPEAELPPARPANDLSVRTHTHRFRLLLGGGFALIGVLLVVALVAPRSEQRPAPEGMSRIPGRTYFMGSTATEIASALATCQHNHWDCTREEFEREQPRRAVTVTTFFLDQHEVTNGAYADWLNRPLHPIYLREERFVESQGVLLLDLHPQHGGIEHQADRFVARPDFAQRPVVQVTWHGARRYCLSQGKELPSEAQWELAARGADPGRHPAPFPWGPEAPRCDGVVIARRTGQACASRAPEVQPVMSSAQDVTADKIFDLGGNAREWLLDFYLQRYANCPSCVDPVVLGPSSAADPVMRVVRGGNWLQDPNSARSAGRSRWSEDYLATGIGFRCALRE